MREAERGVSSEQGPQGAKGAQGAGIELGPGQHGHRGHQSRDTNLEEQEDYS